MKLVKYLPQFGWKPLILTVKNGEYPEYDESLIQDIPPAAKIIRTAKVEPFAIYKRLTGKSSENSIPAGFIGQNGKKSVLENLSRIIRMNLFLPDARIGWLPFAGNAIRHLRKTWQPDIILT
ncbi:MAG: glycosyl transferase family 1, partial [Aliifodinibius sp.]|nr:glycosyl transferase family 1 [Fodinibius sp.]NIX58656.1 glycosyl transferase family 1 [candidate division Zixibacteria bacterium]NIY29038.1 glycosyl transferase family 1 [Fodinibius sp.]